MSHRNHEVTKVQNLLNDKGLIQEEGWARSPMWLYERSKIRASKMQIKEWDYYAVTSMSGKWALCGTVSDLGYASLYSIAYIDYERGKFAQHDEMRFFTFGKTGLSASSKTDSQVNFTCEDMRLTFIRKGTERHLLMACPSLELPDGRVGVDACFTLSQPDDMESMNIATSWEKKRTAFYLNEKVNCMRTSGQIRRGDDTDQLEKDDAWGVLDWGRGRWTYTNTWYWGSGSGIIDGHSFGFNIGYGFSDRTPASENVIFYDNKVHKLDDVTFNIPEGSFTEPWTFTSSDKRFEMEFVPALDRHTNTNLLVIQSDQHQVFGYFTGKAVLDDGTVISIKDFPAFAEKVYNRW